MNNQNLHTMITLRRDFKVQDNNEWQPYLDKMKSYGASDMAIANRFAEFFKKVYGTDLMVVGSEIFNKEDNYLVHIKSWVVEGKGFNEDGMACVCVVGYLRTTDDIDNKIFEDKEAFDSIVKLFEFTLYDLGIAFSRPLIYEKQKAA